MGSMWFFFVKQKTAYEMRISDWSSDVCSSDLGTRRSAPRHSPPGPRPRACQVRSRDGRRLRCRQNALRAHRTAPAAASHEDRTGSPPSAQPGARREAQSPPDSPQRSEEHTSELQSLMRISYAVFCLKKKK